MLTTRFCPASRLNIRMLRMMKMTRNSVPQRWMGGRVLADVLEVERILVLQRVDGHVLGAVVLEDAPDLGRRLTSSR